MIDETLTEHDITGDLVYLVHFDKPLVRVQHYIGFTSDLVARMERHTTPLLRACRRAEIPYKVVRTWPGQTRTFERYLKNRKNASQLCPVCVAEKKGAKQNGKS